MNIREEYMKIDWCHCSNGIVKGNCEQCDKEITDLTNLIKKSIKLIRQNKDSLWPEGISFVQDAKRHGAEHAALWLEMELTKEIING